MCPVVNPSGGGGEIEFHRTHLTRATDLIIPVGNAWTPVPWDNEVEDELGGHSGSSEFFVAPQDGLYLVEAHLNYTTGTNYTQRYVLAEAIPAESDPGAGSGERIFREGTLAFAGIIVSGTRSVRLDEGERVRVCGRHLGGGGIDLGTEVGDPRAELRVTLFA